MSYPVELYIYDLTQGMARSIVPMLPLGLDFNVDGIWHTAIVVHGFEWFFGSSGVERCAPGTTMLGNPLKKEMLGTTSLDLPAFQDYIYALGSDQFAGRNYDLFKHNCNNFSNVVSNFLCSKSIPQYILDLPEQFLRTPIAQMIRPMIEQMAPHDVSANSHVQAATHSAPPPLPRATNFNHFPVAEYQSFSTTVDLEKLMSKMKELNSKNGNSLSQSDLQNLQQFEGDWWAKTKVVLGSWPAGDTFPVLDLVRFHLSKQPLPDEVNQELYGCLKKYLGSPQATPEPAIRLSLRVVANFFAHSASRRMMLQHREEFVGFLNDVVENLTAAKQSELATATIALNYAKAINDEKNIDPEATFQLVSALCASFSQNIKSEEALYRTVVALGSLTHKNQDVKSLAMDLDVLGFLGRIPKNKLDKLDQVVLECKSVFNV